MKCWYSVKDGEWVKGEVTSLAGCLVASFAPDDGLPLHAVKVRVSDVCFNARGFHVTGYELMADGLYNLVTVDVRTTKPKEARSDH